MFMYLKFDLSVYEMSCMQCWLPSNSLNYGIYRDLLSFQVCIELSHFPSMCMRKTLKLKEIYKENLKKVSILEL